MNRKTILNIIKILVVIIILLILLELGDNKTAVKQDTFKGYVLYPGYISDMSKRDEKKIISSYSSFKRYCDKYNQNILLKKYSKDFFENQSLVVIYGDLSSGSYSLDFVSAIREEKNVKVETEIDYDGYMGDGLVTADMSGYLIIIEVDKDIKNIV